MKKIITLFVCAVMAITTICAEDIIVTKEAQKIEAKILEVSKLEIKYKEKDNLSGPTFVLAVEDISSIIYSNGKVVLYNQQVAAGSKEEPKEKQNIDESTIEILTLSGQTITAQVTELKSDHVSYILNGKTYTMPASQIEQVTFLLNGQVKEYKGYSAEEEKAKKVAAEKNSESLTIGRIYRDNGHYLHNDIYISEKEVERILQHENTAAYKEWKKANGLVIGGAVCVGIGGGLVLGGIFPFIKGDYRAALGIECSAIVPLGVGLGLALGASPHYTKAINIYNSKYDNAAIQFKWHVAPNQFGLAIAF